MKRNRMQIGPFTILFEETASTQTSSINSCQFQEETIGLAFYGSGDAQLSVYSKTQIFKYKQTKGFAMSFFADESVTFEHQITAAIPSRCIVIACPRSQITALNLVDKGLFEDHLPDLINPKSNYVEGPNFHMAPEIEAAVDKMFDNNYIGQTKEMFLRSQIMELLAHFFAQITCPQKHDMVSSKEDLQKMYQAKEILLSNIDRPPSLSELARLIGLNTNKLKKNFKALFGMPVFKYLKNERLNMAYKLLQEGELSVQEAAWEVGYESISSFSNAFTQKFGSRPSAIKSL